MKNILLLTLSLIFLNSCKDSGKKGYVICGKLKNNQMIVEEFHEGTNFIFNNKDNFKYFDKKGIEKNISIVNKNLVCEFYEIS